MAAESVCAKRLRYGEKTPTQKVLPARTWHMRTDFELACLAILDAVSACALKQHRKAMPRRELELPPEVARAFVRDMHAFFAVGGTGAVSRRKV
jgi:hypothetical protein